jgi:hypothetical protein
MGGEMAADRFHTLAAEGVSLTLDLAVGHVRAFVVTRDGRRITPLHTAPWVEEAGVIEDPEILPNLKFLSGDFFCAPFAKSDVEDAPPHGWPANSEWEPLGDRPHPAGGVVGQFLLRRPVMGARLLKEITLRDGHPFAYQRHVFRGGNGAVSVASHAMTQFAGKGRVSFSPKAFAETPDASQEGDPARGRSVFATSSHVTDLTKLPLADGSTVDIHRYPVAEGHEDFVMLVEAPGTSLGWAAALRPDARDIMFSLKNPADFPVTFLWFSNGGRYYPPWNRRHVGVLGLEEGRAYSAYGHAASIAPNPLTAAGIPTALQLVPNGEAAVRHVIGGVPLPDEWSAVASIAPSGTGLSVAGDSGKAVDLPFDLAFLGRT